MEIAGTIEDPGGGQSRVTAQGDTYEDAKAALDPAVPEGYMQIMYAG